MAKSAVRNQIRGREGKAAVRRTLNRQARRQGKVSLHMNAEPARTRRSLDRVLI